MKRWSYVPLRRKIWLRGAVVLLLIGCVWAALDYPALTGEGYLRRAERAHLLPEGEILAEIDTGSNGYRFLAADGDDHIEVFRLPKLRERHVDDEGFYLYKKEGDLTAIPLPSPIYGQVTKDALTGCILLFDERPDVQSVELTFSIDEVVYVSQAKREVGGVFLCYFQIPMDYYYKHVIWRWFEPPLADCSAKLYDAKGLLIEETPVATGQLL